MKKIVLFASGSGSNAEKIILHFEKNSTINIYKIFTNNPNAKVIEKAKKHNIPFEVVSKTELYEPKFHDKIVNINPNLIILAGFLLKFPLEIIQKFPNKIINIHPALLPKYGGKGMYGMNVHNAILQNKELESGITIHFVNENYDEGEFIFQKSVPIEDCKTAEEIANKIQILEHTHFPEVIEKLIT